MIADEQCSQITRMDFIFLTLCTLCIIMIIYAVSSIVHHEYVLRQKLKNIPQTGGYPLIGMTFEQITLSEYERITWFIKFMEKSKEGIFVQWIGSTPFVVVYKPEYLEIILSSTVNITKGIPYNIIKEWLGNGLLTSTGKQWTHDRKLIGPTFHFSILNQFAVVISEKAEILIKCIERKIEKDSGKAFDIFSLIANAALDIICETAMGVNLHAQEGTTSYASATRIASKSIMDRLVRPWYWINSLYYLTPAGKRFKSALDTLHGFTREVISKRKIERRLQNNHTSEVENENDEFDIDNRKNKAFLDLLLDQNAKDDAPLTDDELRAQVDTFMFEGYETTAVAMTWTLFLLGNNLEHQEKVHEELKEIFGDSEKPASVKELSQLKYLDRVIKETLRIFPSVPIVTRELEEDVQLDKYMIPKGVNVALPIILTHRYSEIWPEPTKFDPDRFLPENSKHRNPYAYVPFSAGPRNCIGQRFALLEEKIMLTAILRKWKVKSVKTMDAIQHGSSLILRPIEELPICFTPKKVTSVKAKIFNQVLKMLINNCNVMEILTLTLETITRMDFISLALCTFCVIMIYAVSSIVHHEYVLRQKLKNIPRIGRYSLGLLLELITMSEYERVMWFIKFMEKSKEGIFIQWIGSTPFVTVYKPEYLEVILSSTVNITKGIPYNFLKEWLGNGLLTSTGKQWFHDRKLIGPTFHFSILDQFAVVLSEKAEILTKCIERKIEKDSGKAFDIFPLIVNVALDIICETAMGVNLHAQEATTTYASATQIASKSIINRLLQPWYWISSLYYLTPAGKRFKSALDTLHGFTTKVISKRKTERRLQNNHTLEVENENEFDIGNQKRKAFLDLLLDQNAKDDAPLTDDELRAQVDTFMFEGYDTTAVAMTWTLFLLGNNLEHQEKVHEELKEIFGDSEKPASVKELLQLKYLDRVIKETLRIFPSVLTITRELEEDVKLDKYTIPKGVNAVVSIILAHRNSEIWPEPTKFDPDRFLPENSKHRHPYAYVPFSAGPRNCVGQRFALLEEKIVLTAILRKWKVKSVKTMDEIQHGSSLILRPNEELPMYFTPKK
ncbi:uncharacterized protein LOC105832054 [Monomorium pharaonis]|uniref:uncharacterized protein LOC105832054 n=1 Tax=Monomorium pharaonis TaxID=307658 RepID=UPI00174717D1|nr:uncharacterized protein LOC105832054 [Monomorium pharaonis]